VFGADEIDEGMRDGGRLTLTWWPDGDESLGVEAVLFYVGDDPQSGEYFRQSAGNPILARPFFNAQIEQEDAELVAYPDVVQGSMRVDGSSEMMSAAALLRWNRRSDDITPHACPLTAGWPSAMLGTG